jgi:hypothetical protein
MDQPDCGKADYLRTANNREIMTNLGSGEQDHELANQIVIVPKVSGDIVLQLQQVVRARAIKDDTKCGSATICHMSALRIWRDRPHPNQNSQSLDPPKLLPRDDLPVLVLLFAPKYANQPPHPRLDIPQTGPSLELIELLFLVIVLSVINILGGLGSGFGHGGEGELRSGDVAHKVGGDLSVQVFVVVDGHAGVRTKMRRYLVIRLHILILVVIAVLLVLARIESTVMLQCTCQLVVLIFAHVKFVPTSSEHVIAILLVISFTVAVRFAHERCQVVLFTRRSFIQIEVVLNLGRFGVVIVQELQMPRKERIHIDKGLQGRVPGGKDLLLTADSSLISGSESSSNVTSAELTKAYHEQDH